MPLSLKMRHATSSTRNNDTAVVNISHSDHTKKLLSVSAVSAPGTTDDFVIFQRPAKLYRRFKVNSRQEQ